MNPPTSKNIYQYGCFALRMPIPRMISVRFVLQNIYFLEIIILPPTMQQVNNLETLSGTKCFKVSQKASFNRAKDFDKYTLYNARLQNMYRTPADTTYALVHTAAAAFGFKPPYEIGEQVPVCPCCLLQVNTEELPFGTSTTPQIENGMLMQSFRLSSGASLFFTFIKLTIIYLFVLFLTVSIFSLSMSLINTEYCDVPQSTCSKSRFISYSPAKQGIPSHLRFLLITDYLNLIMVLLSICFFRAYQQFQRTIYYTLKHDNQSQDDFTLIVRSIPHMINSEDQYNIHFNYEQTLKTLFQDKIHSFFSFQQPMSNRASILEVFQDGVIDHNKLDPSKLDIVKSISLCFDLGDLQKISKFRDELIQQLPSYSQKGKDNQLRGSMNNPNNKLTVINEQYLELCRSFCVERNLTWTLTRFLGTAFVSFEFQHYKDYLLELYESKPKEFMINNQQLSLAVAPKPQDVQWFNLQVQKTDKIKSMLISYLVIFFVVLSSFFIVQSIKSSQFPVRGRGSSPFHPTHKTISFTQRLLIAALITLFNYILRKIIMYLAARQRHSTKTKLSKAILVKSLVAQFSNTTIIYFILSLLQGEKYLQDDGLVIDTCFFGVVMGGISTILHLFRLEQKIEDILSKLFIGGRKPQKEVQVNYNKAQELPQFDFEGRYSYYLTLVYFCLFFSYINPLNVAVTVVIFFINYWIDKYQLFCCSSMTRELDLQLSILVLKALEPSILVFALGNFYYSLNIQSKAQTVNIIALVLAFTYIFLTTAIPLKLERLFCKPQRNLQANSYSDCLSKSKFQRTYWLTNPATLFTEQPDINRKGEIIDINFSYRIAGKQDISRSRRQSNQESI